MSQEFPVCIHCGAEPVERKDTATDRVLVACSNCRARGAASLSVGYARSTWRLVNDQTMPSHGCKKPAQPRFFQRESLWGWYCGGCHEQEPGFSTLEGAVAGWMRASR